ncbi:MAG: hypothetical protein M3548_02140 [Actinomycetota bacterium]|nr:hypothetical protein [Actinomycetota bacterium]
MNPSPLGGDAHRITRRFFVGAVATAAGAVALGSPAFASTNNASTNNASLDRAVGVVHVNGSPRILALVGQAWVLVDENGSTQQTRGLTNAVIVDVTSSGSGLVAVGSLEVNGEPIATIWESADGVAWREATRLTGRTAEFTAVGASPTSVMALGALLTGEGSPQKRIGAQRTPSGRWVTVPVRGLEWTDELAATAIAGGSGQWIAAAVDVSGSVLSTSRDGLTWSTASVEPRLQDAAVKSLTFEGDRVKWIGNGMGGIAAIAGTLGAGRTTVAVPQEAHAVGVSPAQGSLRSFWLVDGRLVAANV